MKKIAAVDVAIFGGGVAGLWLLNRLRQSGRTAILFESKTLGGGQTQKAQGIIHGGMKYALQGTMTNEAEGMSDMPALWRDCLRGQGELNLSAVPILSEQHYLWSPSRFGSKITGFLAGAALKSKVMPMTKETYPKVFQHAEFKGDVYALDEIVIDVPALVRELVKNNQDAIFLIEPVNEEGLQFDAEGKLLSATVYLAGKEVEIDAQHFVFTAGAGNEIISRKLKHPGVAMQRRPLHMVMVKTPFDYPLYAHCMGLGPRPRITITTHYLKNGSAVWYLGGQLAEDGIRRDEAAQIKATRDELKSLFPWLDFSCAEFSTFMIDRAEPIQKNGLKPETAYLKTISNMTVAWPTKLALAPKLANDVMRVIDAANLPKQPVDVHELRAWPTPSVARAIWEEAFCNDVV